MAPSDILKAFLSLVPGVIAFIEMFRLLPAIKCLHKLAVDSRKALAVIRSPNISDHWKERALPRYAINILASSLLFSFYLIISSLAFCTAFFLAGMVFYGDLKEVAVLSYRTETLAMTLVLGALYAFLRKKATTPREKMDSDYTISSKVLHHLALNSRLVKEMAFDMDCMINRSHLSLTGSPPPVFIAGLARAGTTVLLEALYRTGAFSTLTYRDMPFVTAPYLWNRLTSGHRLKEGEKKERAHGDRLYVGFNSPEAFEEVFWITFLNAAYVKESYLEPHDVNVDLLEKYKRFVINILCRQKNPASFRYLAKNNNNLLRIKALKTAFQDCAVIVPFRNPVDHARSLLVQHERFLERHANDPFSLKYMGWLGHFEFGENLKPFNVNPGAIPQNRDEPLKPDYWLQYWKCVYEFVVMHHASEVNFLDYDKLCVEPEKSLASLGDALALDQNLLTRFSTSIKPATKYISTQDQPALSGEIENLYNQL
jgi:hypothetical protein